MDRMNKNKLAIKKIDEAAGLISPDALYELVATLSGLAKYNNRWGNHNEERRMEICLKILEGIQKGEGRHR